MEDYLQKAIKVNEQMLHLSQKGEWQDVLSLSKKRDSLIKKLVSKKTSDEKKSLSHHVANFLETDNKISDLIISAKSSMVTQGLSMKKSHDAIKRYQSAQSH